VISTGFPSEVLEPPTLRRRGNDKSPSYRESHGGGSRGLPMITATFFIPDRRGG
jgi:hypothetical protein